MTRRRVAIAILLASAFAPAAPTVADPAYLPPFLDRAPSLGDRWLYAAYDILDRRYGSVNVEVVEVEETADGWRYRVDDQLEWLDPAAAGDAPPVVRTEWFLRHDGSVRRGDLWVDGELSVDLRAPLLVMRELTLRRGRQRFGHLGWPRPAKRRGWILWLNPYAGTIPGARPVKALQLRLGDRSHPTLTADYDDAIGRLRWTDRNGLRRILDSAVIDGVEVHP